MHNEGNRTITKLKLEWLQCVWGVGTHCNIGSKRACWPLASDVEPSHVISSPHLWMRGPSADICGL